MKTTGLLFVSINLNGEQYLTCESHTKNTATALQVCYSFYPNFY